MKLEEKLISLRKEKGLSQMKLAEMMNVSRQAISRWEVGAAVPSTDNLKFLGNLYGVSLEYLLHDDAPKPNQNETPMQKRMYISYILSTPFFVPTEKNDSRVIGVFADLSKDSS